MTNKHRLLKINPGLVPALSQMVRCSFCQTTQFASAGSTNAILGGSVARCRPGTPGLLQDISMKGEPLAAIAQKKKTGREANTLAQGLLTVCR